MQNIKLMQNRRILQSQNRNKTKIKIQQPQPYQKNQTKLTFITKIQSIKLIKKTKNNSNFINYYPSIQAKITQFINHLYKQRYKKSPSQDALMKRLKLQKTPDLQFRKSILMVRRAAPRRS